MNIKLVLHVANAVFSLLGLFMIIPAFVNLHYNHTHSSIIYFVCSFMVVAICSTLFLITRQKNYDLNTKETFLLTNLIWAGSGLIAALPMMFAENIPYVDATYEAISGVTTCGGTIFTRLSEVSPGTIFWRSFLQWIGGLGFVLVSIVVFPFLKVGGARLLRTELSDVSEKIMPRYTDVAKRYLVVYSIATILCIVLLKIEGVKWFDAINFGFSTVSTGGFSPHDDSITYYDNVTMYWTIIFFMLFGSVPMALVWCFFRGNYKALLKNSQVRTFITMVVCIWLIMSLWLWQHSEYSFLKAFTLSAFDTTSVISTTGFVLTDYDTWGSFATFMFFFLAFIGGCSGSTTGGIKIFRLQISFQLLLTEIKRKVHPQAVVEYKYSGYPISDAILKSLVAFYFLYLAIFSIACLLISLTNFDFTTIISSVIGNFSSVGVGLTKVTGPFGSFASFPPFAKWLLSLIMLLGRLEIIPLLILLTPGFWRH